MLDRLVHYARSHGLDATPGFTRKDVRWALLFDENGTYRQVLELGDTSSRRNRGQTFDRCPDLSPPELIAAKTRHFLVDTAQVVGLLGRATLDPEKQAKQLTDHERFVAFLRRAAPVVPVLERVADTLLDADALHRVASDLEEHGARSVDKVTVGLLGHDPPFLVQSTVWHEWWLGVRQAPRAARAPAAAHSPGVSGLRRCFVTGDLASPVLTHPKVTGLADVGGIAAGDALISFDKEAFGSYGLQQSENAAVSETGAAAYRAGLNDLLRHHSQRLVKSRVVHWFKESVPPDDDPLPWLVADDPLAEATAQARAARLLMALRTGARPDLAGNTFYVLTLSGAAGRVMVRDWMEGAFALLVEAIEAWFSDLSIMARDGRGLAPPPKFLAVLAALARELKEVSPGAEAKLWAVAIRRAAVPRDLLAQTLRRVRKDVIERATPNHARYGLLRAFHVRTGDSYMNAFLNEAHPEPAYQCGRIMAMLAGIQRRALGDVDAGVIQRYYGAASTTPALVLGRLARNSQFHLNKLEPRLARWHEARLAAVWSTIRDRVPTVLSLEEQSLFALGYYQQLAADRKPLENAITQAPTTDDSQESNHV